MCQATDLTTEATELKIGMKPTFGTGIMKFILEINLIVIKYFFFIWIVSLSASAMFNFLTNHQYLFVTFIDVNNKNYL